MAPQDSVARVATPPHEYDRHSQACKECHKKVEYVHVITHECLEGDALRCVIKAVPNDVPLQTEDYVRVGDLLQYFPSEPEHKPKSSKLPGHSKTKSKPTKTTITGGASTLPATVKTTTTASLPATSSPSATSSASSGIVITPGLSSAKTSSATVITVTATPSDSSTTTKASSSKTNKTTSDHYWRPNTHTGHAPPGGWPFQNTYTRKLTSATGTATSTAPAAPSPTRDANGKLVRPDNPVQHMRDHHSPLDFLDDLLHDLKHGLDDVRDIETNVRRDEGAAEMVQDSAFDLAALFDHGEVRNALKIAETPEERELSSSENAAGIALNPNAANLQQLKPATANLHLRTAGDATKPLYDKPEPTGSIEATHTIYQPNYKAPSYKAWQPHFHVESPYDVAIIVLLFLVIVGSLGGIGGFAVVKKMRKRAVERQGMMQL